MREIAPESELGHADRLVRALVPDATLTLAVTRRSVEGFPPDLVMCVRYRREDAERARWAVVQRVGFQWSATVDLDVRVAHLMAGRIARRSDVR